MGHHHNHDHSKDMPSNRLGWAFLLNFVFTIIEFIGGFLTNSTAILADAVHDLGDSLSLGLAWILNKLGKKQANQHFTYGYKRLNLAGAFINAVVLIAGSAWVLVEAIPRLWNPQMPVADGMIALAVVGITVNGFAAYKLSEGKTLNERVINWHLLEDVLGWVAVLIVGIVLLFVDWPILDPLLSIGFTLFILVNVLRNLWATLKLFIQATPDKETYRQVADTLLELPHVADLHHLHFWSLDGEEHVLTVHLVLSKNLDIEARSDLKQRIDDVLAPYALSHTTVELEDPDEACRDN
ncbi:cation diffusion facilitator family transporter [Pseudidiomarina halophila]|jgi:cobalt-zinc-cadmium efflux system protein|uniref:Cadmium, cobalt and zinc/H(+)-K(+) antiporter n=6 Tax=Idiomarinaceae TaxID=267893 RepID=A0A6S6WRE4_9GAMM|nr:MULTISPECIES: cation diffusion facilitator family transporter [Idiomarinaceae]KTG26610.1 cobalt transporter [Idiomarina sp. H105]OAF00438.1 cobalt transporter [Idiomarina sp. WRN-38]VZT41280.1 Cadmium, cobalt and zinc/H(+)-K(+) antiporter [Pseudomonas aeruginosa]AAV82474.1 Co/Zn/Cd efflux system component [Idiomarina loihiensis L2TR]AGM36513.1 Co/Zn/Cd efflux system protein [Idiomarina loihiensis GSL 199]|tara:strand:- start:8881 stop:9768 length:888 start_codon:yes stop_codon:yes gene_type:complete